MLGLLKPPGLCVRKEFNNLAAGKSIPHYIVITGIVPEIACEARRTGVGAIGMYYSGRYVFAMMVEAVLLAPVAAQFSLPLFQPKALDVEPEALAAASTGADTMSLLGLRSEDDSRCSVEHSSSWKYRCKARQDQLRVASVLLSCPEKDIDTDVRLPAGSRRGVRYTTRVGASAPAHATAQFEWAGVSP